MTSWPLATSCSAMNRPTLPPPAMTTLHQWLPRSALGPATEVGAGRSIASAADGEVDDVALLDDELGVAQHRRARAG